MNETARTTITITKADLRDPKIDEAIELEQSYSPRSPKAAQQKRRFRLIYATWFYLLLAGAIGAFAAWALIEPQFEDGITFAGKIEQVEPDARPSLFYLKVYTLWGRLRVAGADVYLVREKTRLVDEQGNVQPSTFDELKPGQVVKVIGAPAPDSTSLLAAVVQLQRPDAPAISRVGVAAMAIRQTFFAIALFPLVAALVGLMVGGVEGVVCRTFARAAWCGSVGLISGLIGGAISALVGGIIFAFVGLLGADAADPTQSAGAFVLQMFRRGLAWTVAGMAMGLGQGFALKSNKLKLNGLIGGMVGGLLGGLLFDPINLLIAGKEMLAGAEVSRAIGLTLIGAVVGLMIGFTEMLTRDAWLKALEGPLRGKEFSFNRTPIRLGSSPQNEIYLFKDARIDPLHAEINKLRDTYEIDDRGSTTGTFVNGQRIRRHRLVDGDVIKIGDTEFRYSTREKTSG